MSILRDLSLSAVVAGFVTVLVGFTSTVAIVIEAASAVGAGPAEIASCIWALALAKGLVCIGLSLRYRMPVVTAWSTPGAAMLITGAAGVSLSQAIGAFVMSGLLIAIAGFSGWFERAINRIPVSIAAGMLAGVLLRFGLELFVAMHMQFLMVFAMFVIYLVMRRQFPRYAVISALLLGIAIAASQGSLHMETVRLEFARPVWVAPTFSISTIIGVALPLFIVTMVSQNAPGVAAIRASGYPIPISPVIGWTGVANVIFAPFGAFAINLGTITAAICMGREAHEDTGRRYMASVSAGVFYILVGTFGATVGALFAAFPRELIAAIAGLALIGTIGNALAAALSNERDREPALITFLVTASGVSLFGVGSAFWGLIAGSLTLLVVRLRAPR